MKRKMFDKFAETLRRRAMELAAANRRLRRGLAGRPGPGSSAGRGAVRGQWVKDSLRLREALQELSHLAVISHEKERKESLGALKDDIIRTLAGLNLRVAALKQEARNHTARLKKDIAGAQSLVLKSSHSMHRVGRVIGKQQNRE